MEEHDGGDGTSGEALKVEKFGEEVHGGGSGFDEIRQNQMSFGTGVLGFWWRWMTLRF